MKFGIYIENRCQLTGAKYNANQMSNELVIKV